MFQVKICGITRIEDVRDVVECGADAIGLNFYRPSPRSISVDLALSFASALPDSVKKVGVFVNESAEYITSVCNKVDIDFIQLHGDVSIELICELGQDRVVQAVRCKDGGLAAATEFLANCRERDCRPAAVLIDAYSPDEFGGTGKTVDWSAVGDWTRSNDDVLVILAGGLSPQNVGQAIQQARPHGVDTASGVETEPGIKSRSLIEQFVGAARRELGRGAPP